MSSPLIQKKTTELLRFLSRHNQFFNGIFADIDLDLNNGDLETDFKRIPVITKNDIRQNYDIYISDLPEGKIAEYTSGSTGEPLKCLKTKRERMIASANIWAKRRVWDLHVNPDNYFSFEDSNVLLRYGNLYDLHTDSMIQCFTKLLKSKPRWISGPISIILKYVKLIEDGVIPYNNSIQFVEFMGEYVDSSQRRYKVY